MVMLLKCFLITLISLSNLALAVNFDKSDEINGVELGSGKDGSVRHYQGTITKTYPISLQIVQNGITNFDEKCNNGFKKKRELTPTKEDCKYHNENLIESLIIRDIAQTYKKDVGEVERYLVARRIYNRGNFGHYDLIKITHGKNEKNQKTVTIQMKMLSNDEVKSYIQPKIKTESAFSQAQGLFVLTEIGPKTTELAYKYYSTTDHWVLNKEISIPQVFASMSKSINDLFATVDAEAGNLSREFASSK
jgi:hypothetical protein